METNHDLLEVELHLDTASQGYLNETATWAKFLAITGYIMSGLVALVAIFSGSLLARIGAGATIMIIYLGVAAVIFFMSMFLYRFAAKTKEALKTMDQETLATSFQSLKMYFRFVGIINIIGLVFMVITILGAIIAGSIFAIRLN